MKNLFKKITVITLLTLSLSRLCYLVVQANQLRKGVYIGMQWNGPFPNYTDSLW